MHRNYRIPEFQDFQDFEENIEKNSKKRKTSGEIDWHFGVWLGCVRLHVLEFDTIVLNSVESLSYFNYSLRKSEFIFTITITFSVLKTLNSQIAIETVVNWVSCTRDKTTREDFHFFFFL